MMFSSLQAIVIGIDKYRKPYGDDIGAPDLTGAVADADHMEAFLRNMLKVPSKNIISLRNEKATRSNILSRISSLKCNSAIQRDDPILIYFAGHGGVAQPPVGWGDRDPEVQLLIPHDFIVDLNGGGVPGIPDRTLGALFNQLAGVKGDNITVILDCCHSGSGTRNGQTSNHTGHAFHNHLRPRAISTKTTLPPNLDEDILSAPASDGFPAAHYSSMSSHVLMSACGAYEEAFENNGKGVFTEALLAAMPALMEKKLTYYQLLEKMGLQLSKRGLRQNPQCEGFHKGRYIFDNKSTPPPHYFEAILHGKATYKLSAGAIHGITASSQFKLANPIEGHAEKILMVDDLREFSATLKYLEPSPPSTLPQSTSVFESSRGEKNLLGLYFLADDHDTTQLVKHEVSGLLVLTDACSPEVHVYHDGGKIGFALPGLISNSTTIPFSIPYTIDFIPEQLYRIVRAMAHFRWHLTRQSARDILRDKINVHFGEIADRNFFHLRAHLKEDLMHNDHSPVHVSAGVEYALQVQSKVSAPLYVTVFLFDSDLSIRAYYLPGTTLHGYKVDPCLESRGELHVGYGSSGTSPFVFSVPRCANTNMCFIKIFVSTEQVDLSFIEQPSPFPKTTSPLIRKHPNKEDATPQHDPLSRGAAKPPPLKKASTWDAITLPVYVVH
ncbi:hypothetical protein BDW22DRAFT_1431720 [Trametopsis cervina]|nr:hypothetical protein BDW22DRAFT_1431720 [Trametopsis cervina]